MEKFNKQYIKQNKEKVEIKEIKGRVKNCRYLNVREKASLESKVLGAIEVNDIVSINEELSTTDFYAIKTDEIESGYCLKQYIDII